ncbi:MAG: hypothetical protein AAF827_01020 [Cyanobacteria bacterium P01_D01_bin.6]
MITLRLHPCLIKDLIPLTLHWENFSFNLLLPRSLSLETVHAIVATLEKRFEAHPVSSYDEGYYLVQAAFELHGNCSLGASKSFVAPISS